MKQFLRSLCTLLLLVAWASGFAQTTVTFVAGTDKSSTKTLTKDGVTLKYGNGGSLGNNDYYQCFSGSKFTISSINKIINVEFTCTAENASKYGPGCYKADRGNYTFSSYKGTWKGEANEIVFTAESGQVRMKQIVVTLASTKTATTLTFPQPAINIEEGNEASFTGQTATLTAGETVLDKTITYTKSGDDIFATFNTTTGAATLKTGVYGTATVTATYAGDDTYAASTDKYTVNYSEKAKPATTLDFGFATKTVNINETFTATATLKAGETAISGVVTYKSSESDVAYVDETTGEVLALTAGTTTITATFAGTSEYKSSTASYDLTVVDPNAKEETFYFSKPADYGYKAPGSGSATNLEEGDNIQSGVITITNIKSGKSGSNTNKARFHNKGGNITFRVYANGEITLSAQPGYTITKFVFASSQGGKLTVSPGTYDSNTKTWEGNAQSITLTIPNGEDATWFQTMTVTYSKVSANPTLSLDENAEKSVTDEALLNAVIAGNAYDVTLTRTLTANAWNTICLPFDVTAEQIADVLKSAGNVKEFDSEDANTQTIYFKDATTMTAGKPYLIKPTESATELVFKGVKITEYEPKNDVSGDNYAVYGTFGKYTMKTDGTELFLKTDGKFYIPAAGTATMKGFRAYFFNINGSTAGAALNLSFGEATGIDGVAADAVKSVKIYNVNGQYVGTSLEALPKGLYIVGGKKVLK